MILWFVTTVQQNRKAKTSFSLQLLSWLAAGTITTYLIWVYI